MKSLSFLLIPLLAGCAANAYTVTSPDGKYTMYTLENTKGGVFASRTNIIEDRKGDVVAVEQSTTAHPGWALGNTAVTGAAVVGGAYVYAKSLRPDTTSVTQNGGGAQVAADATATGGEGGNAASVAAGGAGGQGGSSSSTAVSQQQQGQAQGQVQGQAQSSRNVNTNRNTNNATAKANSSASSTATGGGASTGGSHPGCKPSGHC